jgi:acetyl-CoA carboxylase carboxyltransferase component
VPAFERAFFEATRTLRNQLGLRDPRRRLQWNRIALFVGPSLFLDDDLAERLARRLAPATRHLGLEKVVVRLNVLDRGAPTRPARPIEVVIADPTGSHMELSRREVHRDPLHPIRDYERKVVTARRRGLVYPYEIVRVLTGAAGGGEAGREETARALPAGHFEEFDLDPDADRPVAVSVGDRPYGLNSSSVVIGVVTTPTEKVPAGLRRVLVLSDPTVSMGSLAAPECDRIIAAIDLAEQHGLPVEWVPVSSGARIAMDSGTENLDATARVARRIITFTQTGGVIHVIVQGVNVGAQSYFNALATMLQHTRGALIMTPGASMVLTGRAALEASGSVSAEDEAAIGGYERVMGPNGEAQYFARDLADAYRILYEHYRYSYVPPGEPGPRRHPTTDPRDRRITELACENGNGHAFTRVGDIFDAEANPGRKRSFAMRDVMRALVDRDGGSLERWRTWEGAETAIVWDAHLGGHPVCLIGIESRNLPRGGYRPSDGPAAWSGGTLFPLSSKKVARALNAASGIRPVVILANLSGFDGSPESMRKLQLEYGAEIARAVVNFEGRLRDRRRAGGGRGLLARGARARRGGPARRGAAALRPGAGRQRGPRGAGTTLEPDSAGEAIGTGQRVRCRPHCGPSAGGRLAGSYRRARGHATLSDHRGRAWSDLATSRKRPRIGRPARSRGERRRRSGLIAASSTPPRRSSSATASWERTWTPWPRRPASPRAPSTVISTARRSSMSPSLLRTETSSKRSSGT